MIAILAGCNLTTDHKTNPDTPTNDISSDATLMELTLDELAKYDGKNDNRAYIAVNGIIYDVTDVPEWANGDHNGYEAGKDLTDFFPHETSRLNRAVKVGILIEGPSDTPSATDNQTESTNVSENTTPDTEGENPASSDISTDVSADADTSNSDINNTTSVDNQQAEDITPVAEPVIEPTIEIVAEPVVEPVVEPVPTEPEILTFTTQSLEQYNGKNGQPAYIAYMGNIYDVTQLSEWRNGNHHGIEAGFDVTSDLQYAPHGAEVLNGVPIIGILVP